VAPFNVMLDENSKKPWWPRHVVFQSIPECFSSFLSVSLFCRWPSLSARVFRCSVPYCYGYWYRKCDAVSVIVLWPYTICPFIMFI